MACEATLKHTFTPKDAAEKKQKENKLNLLLLVQNFLRSAGYIETYHQFTNESKLPKDYEICDNIELSHILQDYETYYFIRFQKYPKISKKMALPEKDEKKGAPNIIKKKTVKAQPSENIIEKSSIDTSPFVVQQLLTDNIKSCEPDVALEKIFKPLGSFAGYSDEWKLYADMIIKDVVEKDLNVKWDDIVGLETAKDLLREAIVYPISYPEMYEGCISPWKGLLLFGPSGTGKTMLARAVATKCKTTFFNISASSIVSKWRGDSEKLVRVMFDLARLQAPSTIFIDELDAIASQRDSNREHEASRRLKSELLIQLDGLCQGSEHVFFLATSNLPWDLDTAILRRLEKRILVDLPDLTARERLIQKYLPPDLRKTKPIIKTNIDYTESAKLCEGYSAFDIKLLCKEISMSKMRSIFKELENPKPTFPCVHFGFIRCDNEEQLKLIAPTEITSEDFNKALQKVKATAMVHLKKYKLWEKEFGSS